MKTSHPHGVPGGDQSKMDDGDSPVKAFVSKHIEEALSRIPFKVRAEGVLPPLGEITNVLTAGCMTAWGVRAPRPWD